MASMTCRPSIACRPGAFGTVRPAVPRRAQLLVSNSYKNLENIDLSKVEAYKTSANDSGSSAVQIARLSARVAQLRAHMSSNRKDHSARRGLEAVLTQRKSLLQYVYRTDRALYAKLLKELGIRSVVVGDTRGAAREKETLDA